MKRSSGTPAASSRSSSDRFTVASGAIAVSADEHAASAPSSITLLLAPGAGTTKDHPFLVTLASGLAEAGIRVIRFQFPYQERGQKRPDPPKILLETYAAAVRAARERGANRLVIGGKSMGGRMASMLAAADSSVADALVFFGYPLHPAGRPEQTRDAHLPKISRPMLFLQGTRDALGSPTEIAAVLPRVGPHATLHEVLGADHSFAVRKSDGRSADDVMRELVSVSSAWIQRVWSGGADGRPEPKC